MSDLTRQEQVNVRTALRYLRVRCGGWEVVSKALRFSQNTISHALKGRQAVTPLWAFRVARLAGVAVDDVLTGKYPGPSTCPYCGRSPSTDPTSDDAR